MCLVFVAAELWGWEVAASLRIPPESFPLTVRENIPQIFHIFSLGFLHFCLRNSRAGVRALSKPQPELSACVFRVGKQNVSGAKSNITADAWVKFWKYDRNQTAHLSTHFASLYFTEQHFWTRFRLNVVVWIIKTPVSWRTTQFLNFQLSNIQILKEYLKKRSCHRGH